MSDPLDPGLVAEHAAIFGYGIVGAHLDGDLRYAARAAEAAHRDRRDAISVRIATNGGTPITSAPAYGLPFAVTDAGSALKLAVALEEAAAAAWRGTLGAVTGDDRRFALDALMGAAVQATKWRTTASIAPLTVPFPGSSPS